MEFQQLKCFKEVVAVKSCTQAAANMGMGRTGVRLNINELENSLSVKLFCDDKNVPEYTLTEPGKILYNYANQILSILEKAKQELRDYGKVKEKVIKIVYNDNLKHTVVPKVCKSFLRFREYEDVAFEYILQHHIEETEKLLSEGHADVAFSQKKSDSLNCMPVAQDQLYILLPAGHPLARKKSLRLSDVADIPFILPNLNYITRANGSNESSLNQAIKYMLIAEHVKLQYSPLYGSIGSRVCYVEAGMGFTITSGLPQNEKKIAAIEIDNPYSIRTVYMLWPKNREISSEAAKFKDFCIDFFKGNHNLALR